MANSTSEFEVFEVGPGRNFPVASETGSDVAVDVMRAVVLGNAESLLGVTEEKYHTRYRGVAGLVQEILGDEVSDPDAYIDRMPRIDTSLADLGTIVDLLEVEQKIVFELKSQGALPQPKRGQEVVLLGPTCAGKTTMARALAARGWFYIPEWALSGVVKVPQSMPLPGKGEALTRYRQVMPREVNEIVDDVSVERGFRYTLYAIARLTEHVGMNTLSALGSLFDVDFITPGSLIQQIVGVIASAGIDYFPSEFLPYLFALPRIPDKIVFLNISKKERRSRLENAARKDQNELERRREVLELEERGLLLKVYNSMILQLRQLGYPAEILVVSDFEGVNEDGEISSVGGVEAISERSFLDDFHNFLPPRCSHHLSKPINLTSFKELLRKVLADQKLEKYYRDEMQKMRCKVEISGAARKIIELGEKLPEVRLPRFDGVPEDLSTLPIGFLDKVRECYQQKLRELGVAPPRCVLTHLEGTPESHFSIPIDCLAVLAFLPFTRLKATFAGGERLLSSELNALWYRAFGVDSIREDDPGLWEELPSTKRKFLQLREERAKVLFEAIMPSEG